MLNKKNLLSIIFLVLLSIIIIWFYKSANININLESLKKSQNIIPIAIIGSGPAGCAAAIYTGRAKLHTIVFIGPDSGGQIVRTDRVENWPGTKHISGADLMQQMKEQAQTFDVKFVNDTVTEIDFAKWPFELKTERGNTIHAMCIIAATGGINKKLGIDGEKQYFGHGVSICGVCDAAFYENKVVAVVGFADAAAQEALLLASFASKVYMINGKEKLNATAVLREQILENKKIEVLNNTKVIKINGNGQKITDIDIKNSKSNTLSNFKIDGLFIGIGQEPNSLLFKSKLKLDNKNYIKIDDNQQTSIPGVFAAGNVCEPKFSKAPVAAGDAVKAAMSCMEFLMDNKIDEELILTLTNNFYNPTIKTKKLDEIISEDQFNKLKKEKLILLDIYSDICPICAQTMHTVEELYPEFYSKIKFFKLNKNKFQEIAKKLKIEKVPTIIILKNGVVDQTVSQNLDKKSLNDLLTKEIRSY